MPGCQVATMTMAKRIEHWPIDRLVPYARNPRTHSDEQVIQIAASIAEFGFTAPILVDSQAGIIAGHGRLLGARKLGLTEVPVIVLDHLTEAQKRAYIIADNKLALNAGWDEELLNAELAALEREGFEMGLTGFNDGELEEILHGETEIQEDDPGPLIDKSGELQKKWSTAAGQIWEIPSKTGKGKAHRLMCGDCTDPEQVKKLMDGERAVLFATDPPYLVGYDGMNHPTNRKKNNKSKDWSGSYGITWDEAKADENQDLYDRFIKTAVEDAIEKNAAWYCWHASRNQIMVEQVWNKYGAFVHQTIIWAKTRPVLTYSVYTWAHEPCFFGWIKGSKPHVNRYNQTPTVWNLSSANFKETNHPTSKPIECFGIPIEMHTRRGDICYEPFAGSGSQLVAAEQLGRIVYACEIAPPYVGVCLERVAVTLGLEPKLLG